MKKFYLILIAIVAVGCSSESEPVLPQVNETVKDIWQTLNGSYTGTFYVMDTDVVWYTETIDFKPYDEPRRIYPMYTYDSGEIYAYGTAEINDTRFFDISGISNCYYVIKSAYEGAIPTISFYEYDAKSGNITNDEDKRNIKEWSSSQFRMWDYGSTEKENSVIYRK